MYSDNPILYSSKIRLLGLLTIGFGRPEIHRVASPNVCLARLLGFERKHGGTLVSQLSPSG